MKKSEVLKTARKMFYKFEIIPEATEAEKEYNKRIFEIKGRPEEYPTFYNKCMVQRYNIYNSNFDIEYYSPITFYTISQLQIYIAIQNAIEKANENCNFDRADELYLIEKNYINSIRPPEVYTA